MSKAEKLKSKRSARSLGGRPRVDMAPRDPSGRITKAAQTPKTESAEQIMAVAVNQPHRRIFSPKDAASPMAGHPGGRLVLLGRLTKHQLATLNRYTLLSLRYMRVKFGRLPRYPCLALERQDRGMGDLPDIATEDLREIEDAHAEALMVIPKGAAAVLFRVGIMEDEITNPIRLVILWVALDRLGRLWDVYDTPLTRQANHASAKLNVEHSRPEL